MSAESIGLLVAICLLYIYTIQAEKQDGIILNGALMALYLTALTIQDIAQLQ